MPTDKNNTMNISSSISQIIYQTQLPGKILLKKAYLWPEYNAGSVSRIAPVNEKTEPALNYVKRSSIDSMKENYNDKNFKTAAYSSKGNLVNTTNAYTPGSIFEALA
jgi:hypothetical protein